MPKFKSTVEVIPSASRLIQSLRDVGYDFVHAVADLVDNSIAAAASKVRIDLRFEGETSWLRVADNGRGMSCAVITEAMRFGSERDYAADDLGKFGLGLKTASLSQCLRLTVASRVDRQTRRIEARQWDLEHVEKTNRWEVFDVSAAERTDCLTEPLANNTGTVVLWENLDRVLGYKIPWGDKARSGLLKTTDALYGHLAMVFHRFITGEARRRARLHIELNGTQVEPWDPFARDEKKTIKFSEQQFEIPTDRGRGLVGYVGYILPNQSNFSTLRRFEYYAGPAKWNFQQGLYVYRSDRMIQSGGWSWLRTADEHTKLARVALDFRPDLDSAFELNIAKARVSLPTDLRNQLKPYIELLTKEARKAYDRGVGDGHRPAAAPRGLAAGDARQVRHADPGDGAILDVQTRQTVVGPSTPDRALGLSVVADPQANSSANWVGKAIEAAAVEANEAAALKRIKKALKASNPEAFHELGW